MQAYLLLIKQLTELFPFPFHLVTQRHKCTPLLLSNLTASCITYRPPSTAMTLGVPQTEAERLLEDRKGGDMHISLSHPRMYPVALKSLLCDTMIQETVMCLKSTGH